MIEASFGGSDRRVIDALKAKGPAILDLLQQKMERGGLELQRHIQAEKLSGQVLRNRTGTLRRSIVQKTERDGQVITTVVAVDPVASAYGKVHEYGGTFTVKEHVRRSASGKQATVRAHSATFQERSFMRSSFTEMKQQIIDGLKQTLAEAAQQL